MENSARIYVAGHRGLAGSALVRALERAGDNTKLIVRSHAELDLSDPAATRAFFAQERPEYVFLAAARVGGIHANNAYPAEFIQQNLAIQLNVIHEAWRSGVKRLVFLGSSCIYPKAAEQPLTETSLLTGPLEPTNRPYAIAKIAGVEMCWSYNRQYGTRFLAAMPTNLYGPGDNYDLANSHVLPALLRKFREAIDSGADEVVIWGSGLPRREFLHSDDMADACLSLANLSDENFDCLLETSGGAPPLINIGVGNDVTILQLAELVQQISGFKGRLRFDPTRPDGTPRKLLDVSKINRLGWKARISLEDGIRRTWQELNN